MPNKDDDKRTLGPVKGDFITPPEIEERDEQEDALPLQEEFWQPPTRFGSIPVEKEPLGWDRRKGYRKLFPSVYLPFQVVDRIQFGHPTLEPNQLFWGDNLHVMRQLPSESIDLIYIDPPFFSGRQYNVIFGDQNELRSFSDIWEGGMPGYLIWLNARLYEMKRLLKKTGSIYVHCDWHASHYIKVEMDKIFGISSFKNEIVWCYSIGGKSKLTFGRKHDVIFFYTKTDSYFFDSKGATISRKANSHMKVGIDKEGRKFQEKKDSKTQKVYRYYLDEGKIAEDYWTDIETLNREDAQRIGYPTQKPEDLIERIVKTSSPDEGVIADFFCGGGTTPAVAQRLGRRWIACDQSRVAVAITADRLTRQVEEQIGRLFPVPDFSIEHWGVYEARRLAKAPVEQFRAFVLKCFGAVQEIEKIDKIDTSLKLKNGKPDNTNQIEIHGYKGAIPVWVGEPDQKKAVTATDVQQFANAMRKTIRYRQDNLRDGIMLAWAFRPDAVEAAERLRRLEHTDLNFIRLDMIRIDSPRFREHVTALSTDNADYMNFLTFVQPPKVEVGYKRIAPLTYKFDVSETVVLNAGAKIINVQWDFDYDKRFSSTQGYSFVRSSKKEPELQAQYVFTTDGKKRIACKVQDDMGGEGLWVSEIEVK
ncbi:MAG TPA: site-specific DNA-methyltransferase [bacterium]|nr:site-specific DNA-methyltransferase [bacterium]HPN46129.1 site-specific DNA-methyltransferase [bacterium]